MSGVNEPSIVAWSHIELTAGTVTSSTAESADGIRQNYSETGKFMFSIDAIESDGGRLGLNTCKEYEDAIRLAEAARINFEIDFSVKDNVVRLH